MTKANLKALRLEEISLVDRPANPGARVTLYKRQEPLEDFIKRMWPKEKEDFREALQDAMEERFVEESWQKVWPLMDALHESVKGCMSLPNQERDKKLRDNVEQFLSSVRGTLSEDEDEDDYEAGDRITVQAGLPGTHQPSQESVMDVKDLEKKLGEFEAQVTQLTNDNESVIKERDELKKQLEEQIAKGEQDEDFITIDGEQVLKSAVPAPLLKRLEDQQARIEKMEQAEQARDLQKRAEEAFPNLAGTPAQKGLLIKALDGIEVQEDREAVEKSLKAADAAVSRLFKEVGTAVGDDSTSATARLKKMAEDRSTDKGESYETAFAEVTKTSEGRKLWLESRAETLSQ